VEHVDLWPESTKNGRCDNCCVRGGWRQDRLLLAQQSDSTYTPIMTPV
jgi:hypothetical protein